MVMVIYFMVTHIQEKKSFTCLSLFQPLPVLAAVYIVIIPKYKLMIVVDKTKGLGCSGSNTTILNINDSDISGHSNRNDCSN